MPKIIMDSCNYTRLGLSDYISAKEVKKKNIASVSDIEQLQQRCEQLKPGVVFINAECFIHESDSSDRIRSTIMQHPDTLLFIFMAISNIHFEEYPYVLKKLIIKSK